MEGAAVLSNSSEIRKALCVGSGIRGGDRGAFGVGQQCRPDLDGAVQPDLAKRQRGVSWRQLSSPGVWSISKIVTTQDGGLSIATTGNGVFFSDSGGDFWQTRSRGLPPGAGAAPITEIEDLLISPTESNTLFVVAAFLGVFKSEDGGRNWEPRNSGLPAPFSVADHRERHDCRRSSHPWNSASVTYCADSQP